MINKNWVTCFNIIIGARVSDNDGDCGVIDECSDLHNVNVIYDSGGAGLFCLAENCEFSDYKNLFYIEKK